ncbi:MAG: hypothetical protein CSYNP_02268 [Syntrophus sp. SKADARSKE-3]|nr:hypothetical protein [Syntrophus sp. SKADARSKE-3]
MELTYQLIRSRKRKKTLSMKITGAGEVVIQAPYNTPAHEIDAFFERKEVWLRKKLKQLKDSPPPRPAGHLASGAELLFLGTSYPLIIEDIENHSELFLLQDGRFLLNNRVRRHGKALIRAWYEGKAKAYFPDRVEEFSRMWGLRPEGLRISNAASRWGSCSPRNVLSLTWRLMMAPPSVIDYVIIHELAHIREKNHGRSFWALVAKMMPEHETHRGWLRKNGHRLNI